MSLIVTKRTIMREYTGILTPYVPVDKTNNLNKSKLYLIESERGIEF